MTQVRHLDRNDQMAEEPTALYTGLFKEASVSSAFKYFVGQNPTAEFGFYLRTIRDRKILYCEFFGGESGNELRERQLRTANARINHIGYSELLTRDPDRQAAGFDGAGTASAPGGLGFAFLVFRHGDIEAIQLATMPATADSGAVLQFRERLSRLRPLFQGAFRAFFESHFENSRYFVRQQWLEHLSTPAVIVDSRFSVIVTNRHADDYLSEHNFVGIRNDRLVGLDHILQLQPFRPKAAPESAQPASVPMVFECKLNSETNLYAAELPVIESLPPALRPFTSEALYIIFFVDIGHNNLDIHATRCIFDLTAQEANIVHSIISGKSLRQAANELGIKYNTARTHIANATRRGGYKSQTDFVRIAERISARMPYKAKIIKSWDETSESQ